MSEFEIGFEVKLSPEIKIVMQLAEQAGKILKKYHQTTLDIDYKKDQFDPVSIADRESDELLRSGIAHTFPGDEILSEENPLLPSSYSKRVWMIDPLDDTKGYLAGRDSAGIMIGMLENKRPKLGVVFLPFRNEWFYGEVGRGSYYIKNGKTSRLQVVKTKNINEARLVGRNILAGDIRPIDDAIAQLGFASVIPEGCIGAKIGLIASGDADAFIHTNLKAGKWDTLAAEVILNEAGGFMCDIDGKPLDYTKADSGWNRYFVAACTNDLLNTIVSKLQAANDQSDYF